MKENFQLKKPDMNVMPKYQMSKIAKKHNTKN